PNWPMRQRRLIFMAALPPLGVLSIRNNKFSIIFSAFPFES
ncbi:hypothetical protein ACZ87_03703, partial [Candidatus Erwinia dacicola]